MRTDSPTLSSEAVQATRAQAAELYGPESVTEKPRVFQSKDTNAQEAHEAIRPAGDRFRTPDSLSGELRADEFRMYELIWRRTLASQMRDAKGTTSTVRIGAETSAHRSIEFTASGTVITSPGFLAVYEESHERPRYEEDEERVATEGDESRLPQLEEGQGVRADEIEPVGHHTTPPPRYTQGSMIKELEDRKFGRPSTYAATVDLIIARNYVRIAKQALIPNWVAFSIVGLLEKHFDWLIDYDFTADMERDLDLIASGELDRRDWLARFYLGTGSEEHGRQEGLKHLVNALGSIDARAINTFDIGEDIAVRVGRYGPYVERLVDGEPERAAIPPDLAPDELTVEKALEFLRSQGSDGRILGTHPETGRAIVAKAGRYGPYVTETLPDGEDGKPRTASLFKTMNPETVTLEEAVTLLSLPRVVGVDPTDGQEITAQNGRFGPYLKKGTDSRSLETEEQLLTVTLDEALALYAQPKRGRGRPASPPLRELGIDPATEKPIVVKDGRFGPYITDGETNVTVPRGEPIEELTHERAVELLADKRARGPAKKPARRSAAKRTPAKRTTKKPPAKKKP
jgi:DNA topoisomerase I